MDKRTGKIGDLIFDDVSPHLASRVAVSAAKTVHNPSTQGLLQLKVLAATSHVLSVSNVVKDLTRSRQYLKEFVLALFHDKYPSRPRLFYKLMRRMPSQDGGCGEAPPVWIPGSFSGNLKNSRTLWEDSFSQLRYGSASFCAGLKTAIEWHRRENGRMWYFCPAPFEYDRLIAIRRLRREDAPDDVVSFLKMSNENHISMSEVVDRCLECNLPTTLAHSICDSLPSTTANHVEKVLAHSLLPRHKLTKPAT